MCSSDLMKELREHWKAFEAFLQPKKYPVDNQFTGYFESKNRLSDGQLEKAQLKLQEILAILPEVHRCSSLIRPFLQSCDILLKGSLNNTDFVLTQAMLKHFYAETTTELNRVEGQRKWAYVHLAFYREPPRYLAPYDALMDALKMYNFWFGPGVESLQETIPQLALSIKQSAEVYWNYLVQQIQEYEQFCNPVDYELYFKDSYQSFIPSGTLITLYHRQLEEGLIQVRLTTSQQQIKNTLLYEEWLGLNQQLNLLNQIYDGHLEQELLLGYIDKATT